MATLSWAIVRSQKWYHVSRVVEADGALWEMYWHLDIGLRGPSKAAIRSLAWWRFNIDLLDDVLRSPPGNTTMNKLERET